LESKGKFETVAKSRSVKIPAPDNIQQCPQGFWKTDLATKATLKGPSLSS